MHFYRFQYGPEYGAPMQARANSANYVTTASLASAADRRVNPSAVTSFGSIPAQLKLNMTAGLEGHAPRRTVTLTSGSLPAAQVYIYDANDKLVGGLTGPQFPQGNATAALTGRQDIDRITIVNGQQRQNLDLRQAQGWLNDILNVGVTVGLDGSGQLVGTITNMDAVQNTFPDRDGVTFGTKCTYILSENDRDGGLYCG